ncbi:MAG: glycosyltransferase [Anaerolineales bacterium]|nr:glycosyltransferase [Anaerolineales bacterium]
MNKVRVLNIIDDLRIGGAQKLLVTFAKEARRRCIPVGIVCLQCEESNWIIAELEANDVSIAYLPAGKLLHPGRFWRLVRYIRSSGAEVVQTHLTYANILGSAAAFLAGIPAVATLHLAGPDLRYSKIRELLETWCIKLFSRLAIAVGPQTGRLHARRLGVKRIEVVLNAVEVMPPVPAQRVTEVRRSLGIGPDTHVLVSVGRFSIVKAFHILIEAFAAYNKQEPDSVLLLVGDGEMRTAWEQLAKDLGVSASVRFTGLRNDVPDLLAASDLYVCSSTIEGTPLAVMEAISAGLPVVSTNIGDLPEIIDPDFGVLVEPEDAEAITTAAGRILQDPVVRQKMAGAARAYAQTHFSSVMWMDALLLLYAEAIGSGRHK